METVIISTNGKELKDLLNELEIILEKINNFKLKVVVNEPLVQELVQQ